MTGMKGIYSVFDKKAGIYLNPFVETTNGTAVRVMQDLVANGDHPFAKHAEDYQLVKLAEFGEHSGSVKPVEMEILINLDKLIGE
jgi:hypothetical protein